MFKKRGEYLKTMEREAKTSWKELIKAFVSSDSQLEEQNNEEVIEFNNKYSKILSQSKSDISSLEAMLDHPDVKVRGQGRRTERRQTRRTRTKQPTMENISQRDKDVDKEIER